MKIDTAIASLEDLSVDDPHFDPERRREAIKLGIEALKRLSMNRITDCPHIHSPLRGETKE